MRSNIGTAVVFFMLLGVMAFTVITLVDRQNEADRRMNRLQEQVEDLQQDVSFLKEATPTEPEEATLQIEILECYKDTEEGPSEAQEGTSEEEEAQEATDTTESQEKASGELEYAGVFELTAYAWTGNPCANGNYPTAGHTVASNYFPLGTRIYIEGMGEYMVEDRGGMASNVIDIYMGDHNTCVQFGRQQAGIYIVN